MTIADLISELQALPPEWRISATRAGDSLMVWEGDRPWVTEKRYGYVFTDGRPTKLMTNRN